MLIEFSVGNYLSIKDKQTLRMDASSITEYQDRLIDAGRYKLLRSAVIYGANASGKSNVLKAIAAMSEIITTSAAQSSTATISVEPFLLSTETEHAPSHFEMLFLVDRIRYRYGFEADQGRIHAEWLFEAKKQQEKALFIREGDSIQVSKTFKEGKGLEERTSGNKLFLAICDQFNGELSKKILFSFSGLKLLDGHKHEIYKFMLSRIMQEEDANVFVNKFLSKLNLGFSSILFENEDEVFLERFYDSAGKKKEKYAEILQGRITKNIYSIHHKYDSHTNYVGDVSFDTKDKESEGTKKILDLMSVICLSLFAGRYILIDELDSKLHPLLTKEIIDLFNDPETNTKNAQLIFATHDTNLLTHGQFRRDQIYFTEKDEYGATSLYSLVEHKEEDGSTVRKDRAFEKDYIQGRYGAIPYIGDFSKLFS